MSKPDGGSAYPMGDRVRGVSVRDYFAQTAPIDLGDARHSIANEGGYVSDLSEVLERLAQLRFAYADWMIAERSKP